MHGSPMVGLTTEPILSPHPTAQVGEQGTTQEDGFEMSATYSEYTRVMRYWAKKASWSNRVLTSHQRDALRTADERFDIVQLGVWEMVDVFSSDIEVKSYYV